MRERQPVSRIVKASEARQRFSELTEAVFRGESRVIIERGGIPVVAIVAAAERRKGRLDILEQTWEAFSDVPDEELEREIAHALDRVRQEARERRRSRASA